MLQEKALNLLQSEDKSDIRYAIQELENYPSKKAIAQIVKVIQKKPLKSIILSAKETLLTFKDLKKELIEELKPLLYTNEPKLRNLLIEVASYFKDEIIEYLDEFIKSDDYNVRKYALDILSAIPTKKSLNKIMILINDENANVKYSAIEYLEYFRAFEDDVMELLIKAINELDINDMYGVIAIYTTITKGIYKSEKLLNASINKLKDTANKFIKHYLYKIAIYEGEVSLKEEALKNAKEINLEVDLINDLNFILKEDI